MLKWILNNFKSENMYFLKIYDFIQKSYDALNL